MKFLKIFSTKESNPYIKSSSLMLIAEIILVGTLILPWIYVLKFVSRNSIPDSREFLWALKNSVIQAAGSSAIATVLGVIGALGLIGYGQGSRHRRLLNVLFLGPSILPTLFSLVACLQIFGRSIYGLHGVCFVHGIINGGMLGVFLANKVDEKLGQPSAVALVLGADRWLWLRCIFFPVVKQDLARLSLLIFVFCFSALTVPMVIGGQSGTTLEVLILEKLRVNGNIDAAIGLTLLQSLVVAGFSLAPVIFLKSMSLQQSAEMPQVQSGFLREYSWKWGLVGGLFGLGILCWGIGGGIFEVLALKPQLTSEIGQDSEFLRAVAGTLLVMVGVFVLVRLFLYFTLWMVPFDKVLRKTEHLSLQSIALSGFGVMMLIRSVGFGFWVSYPVSLLIIFWPSLLRMGWMNTWSDLRALYESSLVMGARHVLIVRHILWPSVKSGAGRIALFSAVWAGGDFAVAGMYGDSSRTLPVVMAGLLSGYRLNLACLYAAILLFLLGVVSFVLAKVFDVEG